MLNLPAPPVLTSGKTLVAADPLPFAAAPEPGELALAPDGATLAYLVKLDGAHQLWLRQLSTGRRYRVQEPVLPCAPSWLTGNRLAFLARASSPADGAGTHQVVVVDQRGRTLRRYQLPAWVRAASRLWATGPAWYLLTRVGGRGTLVSLDPETGTCVPLTAPSAEVRDASAAPDGTLVLVVTQEDTAVPALAQLRPCHAGDTTEPGELRILAPAARAPGTREQLLDLSPDGSRVLYSHDDGAGRYSLRWLRLADTVGGRVETGGEGTVMRARWRGDSAVVQVFEGTRCVLREIPVAEGRGPHGGPRELAQTGGGYPGFAVASGTGRLAFTSQRWDAPPDIWVTATATGTGRPHTRVTDLHAPLRARSAGPAEEIHWHSGPDGTRVDGVLVRPPGAGRGPLPMVVALHGGPHHHWHLGWHGSWINWAQPLAAEGVMVLCPNVRGSTGRGWEFAHAVRGDIGDLPLTDLLSGVDHLVAAGLADPDRLGIGGWSYGAYLAAWTVTRTDRFRAAVIGAGIYDMHELITTSPLGPAWRGFVPGAVDDEDRRPYDALSPRLRTASWHTPTLFIHGAEDRKVPVEQSRRTRRELARTGTPAELLELPGEGHVIERTAHRARLLRAMTGWYGRYL